MNKYIYIYIHKVIYTEKSRGHLTAKEAILSANHNDDREKKNDQSSIFRRVSSLKFIQARCRIYVEFSDLVRSIGNFKALRRCSSDIYERTVIYYPAGFLNVSAARA